MTKNELFSSDKIDLLCPQSNELLLDFVYLLGYDDMDLQNQNVKEDTLFVIEQLLEIDILYVHKWYENPKLDNTKLSVKETLDHLDKIWFKGAKYPDFFNMVIFGSKDWYVKKLQSLGMNHTTNWKWFVKNKIGNLEKWIEENRPKG